MRKGSKHSKETKRKIGLTSLGRFFSKEVREKMRVNHLNKKHSAKTKLKMSRSALSSGTGKWNNGYKHTEEVKKKMGESKLKEKNPNWQGGITPLNNKIRISKEYKLWREAVFKRDNYQCIWGGKEHGTRLQADHIKSFAHYPELRFAIDNGRTLCVECHRKTDTWGGRNKKLF